jgi:ketosteroid isomerase-like protein
MSEQNLEIVRGIYAAVARRDAEAAFDVYAEDIVWDVSSSRRVVVMDPLYQGHEGVRRFWRDALAVFGEIDLDVQELIGAGDQVVAVIHEREIGRSSGAPVTSSHVAVWTLADRKVVRMQIFDERADALAAIGLPQ